MLAIGMMSGTSADGIDGVILELPADVDVDINVDANVDVDVNDAQVNTAQPDAANQPRARIVATANQPFAAPLRDKINALITTPTIHLDELGALHAELGECYAHFAQQLIARAERKVAVIGCHGQTVRHQPHGQSAFTMQLGDAARIACRTATPVVADFRSADIAAGGQGAPLATGFHHEIFADASRPRAVLNLGGIANITHLPNRDADKVIGFDTGPANTLIDEFCAMHFNAPFDQGGALAARGEVQSRWLDALLQDEYFTRPPPKSTGREHFNRAWLAQHQQGEFAAINAHDALATLTALTAESIARQLQTLHPAPAKIYACGGGVRNATLMQMLTARSPASICLTDQLGIDAQWVEASAFAWMAARTLRREVGVLPSVTGARWGTVAGAVYWGR